MSSDFLPSPPPVSCIPVQMVRNFPTLIFASTARRAAIASGEGVLPSAADARATSARERRGRAFVRPAEVEGTAPPRMTAEERAPPLLLPPAAKEDRRGTKRGFLVVDGDDDDDEDAASVPRFRRGIGAAIDEAIGAKM